MREIVNGILLETWALFLVMSPYLLLGFTFAGILKISVSDDFLRRQFSGRGISPVLKASLVGLPLPLCSCSVIPLTAYLRNLGSSKACATSFLISTPGIGLSSILATASLLGWIFAFIRMFVNLFIGVFAGVLVSIFVKDKSTDIPIQSTDQALDLKNKVISSRFMKFVNYAYVDLVRDVSFWLILGLFAGGMIAFLVPPDFVSEYLAARWSSYTIMLLLGLPMYVCATGSIPIVAPLVMMGMSPGAALIFLIVGPATNTALMSFVLGKLGGKVFFIYIISITLGAFLAAFSLDQLWSSLGLDFKNISSAKHLLPHYLKFFSSIFILIIMLFSYLRRP